MASDVPENVAQQMMVESTGNIQASNRNSRGVFDAVMGAIGATVQTNLAEVRWTDHAGWTVVTDRWMHGLAAAVAQRTPARISEIMRDVRAGLAEQMDEEAIAAGTVGGSHRDESGGATSGDVATESGSGEPSGETETLAE